MNLFSLEFLILLTVLFILYYVVPKKFQWVCLLAASIIFYAFSGVEHLIFIGITSFTTYMAGILMSKQVCQFQIAKKADGITKEQRKTLKKVMVRRKRIILIATLLINFGILAYFKYWQTIYNGLIRVLNPEQGAISLGILLPLGISFYTFQAVGYLIDQYNGAYEAEKNYFKYLLFVSFFPQMIQGPINRFPQMERQFFQSHGFDWEGIKRALFLILFGLMKKYAIANLLVDAISVILDAPTKDMPGSVIVAGILMYSAQQYADFSGGIDLVMGIAGLFGIQMMPNFRQPYFAVSLADFWRRWHITLGAWMKDYVFYPFALTKPMQRVGKWGMNHLGKHVGRVLPACVGNILVFFIVGIWHGAQSHFILWGLYNGIVIAMAELLAPVFVRWKEALRVRENAKWYHIFCVVRTFLIVNIGWYFDRIVNFDDCMLCFKNTITHFGLAQFVPRMSSLMSDVLSVKVLPVILLAIVLVFIYSYLSERGIDVFALLSRKSIVLRWGVYYTMLVLIQFSMSYATSSEAFMYAVF
ncbi:MAG: MBOAT family protein [Clostridiales bacterium]|nr:MBOAT family protein [Clostridiales bacterium]